MASNPNDGETKPCCYSNSPGTQPLESERGCSRVWGAGGEEKAVDAWLALGAPPLQPWAGGLENSRGDGEPC